jgi:XTP/dITP diphosphohydrolase
VRTILIATRNKHKTREIGQMLGQQWTVLDLSTLPDAPEIEETGATFQENAALKALAISQLSDELIVADDSGLEVDALQGAPGVYSARYAGKNATDAENRHLVMRNLAAQSISESPGRFRCSMAVARKGELLGIFDGTVEGKVILEERGSNGFGYDPIFVPEGLRQTFGEVSAEMKHSMSHRARALKKLVDFLSANRSANQCRAS